MLQLSQPESSPPTRGDAGDPSLNVQSPSKLRNRTPNEEEEEEEQEGGRERGGKEEEEVQRLQEEGHVNPPKFLSC